MAKVHFFRERMAMHNGAAYTVEYAGEAQKVSPTRSHELRCMYMHA